MLFYPAGFPKPQRVQGAFVSDEEVGRVVEFLTEQGMTAQYNEDVISRVAAPSSDGGSSSAGRDEYFAQAGKFIIEKTRHPLVCCRESLRSVLTGRPVLWTSWQKPEL